MKAHSGKNLIKCVSLVICLANFCPIKVRPLIQSKCYPLILVSTANRLDTRVVVIDFHQAENRNDMKGQPSAERSG
jgi:hypothetical protein